MSEKTETEKMTKHSLGLRDNDSVVAERSETTTDLTQGLNHHHGPGLQKNFSLISLIGIALVVSNTWAGVGGSILVAIFNGGPPGKPSLQSPTKHAVHGTHC
jgi:hypothetical protein